MKDASIDRSIKGSRNFEDFYRELKNNRHNGAGCCRPGRTTGRPDIMEKAECGEQLHRGQQECYPNDRHGEEDQGGGIAEREIICEVYAFQERKKQMWANWTICKQADCYGCYFKMNAV
eukprot:8862692-Heterocapsa_arctica.AAC.1